MSDQGMVAMPPEHAVSIFSLDGEAVAAIARYVADGLAGGERVVVVMTPTRVEAVDTILRDLGHDPQRARESGAYVVHDVATTLATFLVDGRLDGARLLESLHGIVSAAPAEVPNVRICGELVARLWEQGNVSAALELEALWGDLAQHHPFSRLCAYPTTTLGHGRLDDVRRMCELHTDVLVPTTYLSGPTPHGSADASSRTELFLPVPAAVPAARRFVERVLGDWGLSLVSADAVLVASELATNAVNHAESPFRVSVQRRRSGVRIAIEDAGPRGLLLRPAELDDVGGRGVAIVAALSEQWACEKVPGGKVVWADLGNPGERNSRGQRT